VGNLHRVDTPEVRRVFWDVLRQLAHQSEATDPARSFSLREDSESVVAVAFERCREGGLLPADVQSARYPPFIHVAQRVFEAAKGMGLLLRGRIDQGIDWNLKWEPFHFTSEGIRYFTSDVYAPVDDPGHFCSALVALRQKHDRITEAQTALLLEAQKCLHAGCFRAATVLVGVACEDACLFLLDSVSGCLKPPGKGSATESDWASISNTSLSFAARWKPGLRFLESMKQGLRQQGRGADWWQWWETVPGSLSAVGEAIRVSRNAAAHDSERAFGRSEAALLLAALPIVLETVCELESFLRSPPAGVQLPSL